MIIVKLWGGLGNQLFQYAYGYSLAKRLGTELRLDISFYHRQTLRKPVLLKLNIDEKTVLPDEEIPELIRFLNTKNPNRIIRIPSFSKFPVGGGFTYLKESRRRYHKKIHTYHQDNTYIDGYWQCEKYFKDYTDDLRRQFSIDLSEHEEIMGVIEEIQSCNSISLHIRRGDYVNKRKFYSNLILLGDQYFQDALETAINAVQDPVIYVFTDDVDWVRQHFTINAKYKMISDMIQCSDVEELLLMSKCRNHITSNSTYSWWAAWLNDNPEKQVWSPDKGWGNKHVLPEDWHRIEVLEYT